MKPMMIALPPTGAEMNMAKKCSQLPSMFQLLGNCTGKVDAKLFMEPGHKIYKPLVHSTNTKTHLECPRKFYYRERLGLRRRGLYSAGIHRGQVFHMVAAMLFEGKTAQEAYKTVHALMRLTQQDLRDSAHPTSGLLPSGKPVDTVCDDIEVDTWKAYTMARVFYKKWPPDVKRFKILAVERKVLMTVSGISRPVSLQLDLVLAERGTKNIWIMDHKVTSGKPWDMVHALRFELQSHLYRLGAWAEFPHNPVRGMIHNVIKVPGIKYCPKTKDKPEDGGINHYLERVVEWYEKGEAEADLGGMKQAPLVQSEVLFLEDRPPRDMMLNLGRASVAANRVARLSDYPRCGNNYTCVGMAGMFPCEYLSLCATESPQDWKGRIAAGEFIQRHRDVEDAALLTE